MAGGSARLLARLLEDDPALTELIDQVEAGAADDAAIEGWVYANQQRIRKCLVEKLPPVPALRNAVPTVPSIDGWAPRADIGVARLGVESSSATLQGQAKVHVLGLLPPDTALFSLNAGPVSGGGQIQVAPNGREASGALGLQLGTIKVNAFAKLDEVGGATSVVVVLGIRFTPPIQLSFGFALSAVGGVIGVHRRIDVDALRARLSDGSALDALFPTNPEAGASRLLQAIAAIFKPSDGQHVVGPTFTITWLDIGVTTLVRMDVAVLVQVPDGKVVVAGRAAVDLAPVLALRLDVVGELDPGRKLVAIDAVLVDSRALALFRVTGTAAFRSCAADPPYVVATLGGFYPGFHPEPAALPPQQRLGLALDVPCPLTVRANGYLAITSNTFQVGADLEVGIDLDVIGARGFLRFDAIVQFDPFHLHADYAAGWEVWVSIFSGGTTVSGWIDGPGPWTVHARVSISLLLDDFTWSDTFRFGPVGPAPTPAIPFLANVVAETAKSPSNLKASDATDREVAIRPRAGGQASGRTLCSPLATLTWSQSLVPLDLRVRRVGGRRLASEQWLTKFAVEGAVAQVGEDASEWFAPGTYLELSQAEALALPPFLRLKAGKRLELQMNEGSQTSATRAYKTFVRRGPAPTEEENTEFPLDATLLFPLRAWQMLNGRLAAPVVATRSALASVKQEDWVVHAGGQAEAVPSAAHAIVAARGGGVALAAADRPIGFEAI